MSIEDKIRNFVQNYLYMSDERPLADDDSFLAEGIIDSMGAFELATFVEKEFGFKVDVAEIVVKNFDSVGQLGRFVRRKLGAPVPAPMAGPSPTLPQTVAAALSIPAEEMVASSPQNPIANRHA